MSRLLSRRRGKLAALVPVASPRVAAAAWIGALILAACGAPDARRAAVHDSGHQSAPTAAGMSRAGATGRQDPEPSGPGPTEILVQDPAPPRVDGFGPGILLPATPARDEVVARVGDIEIRKSQVFDRLVDSSRRGARSVIDALVIDAVVAEHAQRHQIHVDAEQVEAIAQQEEELVRSRVRVDWGGQKEFEDYVREQFDLEVEEYRHFLRLELARNRYRGYVIRFLALLEDQVEVRILAHRDRAVVESAAQKVREGADFATLAFRNSEDETRSDGGRMPPFSRSFEHPIAKVAFELKPGELSQVFEVEAPGDANKRWCVVYCLRRMPGREGVRFADVRAEIDKGLDARALTPFEQKSFALRWCEATSGF